MTTFFQVLVCMLVAYCAYLTYRIAQLEKFASFQDRINYRFSELFDKCLEMLKINLKTGTK